MKKLLLPAFVLAVTAFHVHSTTRLRRELREAGAGNAMLAERLTRAEAAADSMAKAEEESAATAEILRIAAEKSLRERERLRDAVADVPAALRALPLPGYNR